MSNTDYKGDEMKINAKAFLQEFYGKGILDRFCEACEEYQCNALDAVLTLKYLLMNNLALEQSYPDFPDLAEMYARRMDLDAEAFTHNFYISRRDQQ